jgi:aspartyl/asparaginyl beta-hydroxylase (cupin superfamily)
MPSTAMAPWFADYQTAFRGSEPFFYDARQFPWVAQIESQWDVIRDELLALLREHQSDLVAYANHDLATTPTKWKSFLFMYWKLKSHGNCAKCPRTWAILSSIPNITSCGFSLLEPGTTIKPHQGDTNAVLRCHLGLVVPASAPECAFRVGNETRSWREGEMLMFCDAHFHTAWNNTDSLRCILLFDVIKPEYQRRTISISSRVLSKIYLEIAYQRLDWLRRYVGGRRRRAMLDRLVRTLFQVVLHGRLPVPPLWTPL